MGERDPRRGSARLPGSVLQATGDPVGDRHLSLLLRYTSSCPSTSRCKGSTASSRSLRSPRSRELAKAAPSKDSRAPVWCEVRERYTEPYSSFTGPSRGLSDRVLHKP